MAQLLSDSDCRVEFVSREYISSQSELESDGENILASNSKRVCAGANHTEKM